jgi:hypothetical protein
MKTIAAVLMGLLLTSVAMPAQAADTEHAADREWKFELTPYLWAAGIDADVTVRNTTVAVDVGFSDLIDKVDVGGSFLTALQYKRFVGFGQVDYVSMNTDQLDNATGELDSDALFATVAVGYQLNGPMKGSTIDVMGGVRLLNLDNTLTLNGRGTFEKSQTITDGVLVVRPSLPLTTWLRFSPTLAIGAGDSDLTYELQPELQFRITDNIAARVGYRRVFYDFEGDRGNRFDGSFHGFILGVGLTI